MLLAGRLALLLVAALVDPMIVSGATQAGGGRHYPPLDLLVANLITTISTDSSDHHANLMAMHEWQSEQLLSSDKPAAYLVCAMYGHGHEARELLELSLSILGVYTVCNDTGYGACFVVTAHPFEAEAMLNEPEAFGLTFAGPVLPILKLSPGLVEYSSEETTNGQAAGLDTTHGEHFEMSGVTSLGVRLSPGMMDAHNSSADALVEEWYAGLSSDSTTMEVSAFLSDPEITGEVSDLGGRMFVQEWTRAAELLRNLTEAQGSSVSDVCGWDEVQLHPADDDIVVVAALDHLLHGDEHEDSETRTACFMALLSHLATKPEVLRVSALRAGCLLNHAANAIVQSASISSTPLLRAGLDGTGEVIQMIDSGLDETSCFFMDEDGLEIDHGSYYSGFNETGRNRYLVRSPPDSYHFDLSRRKVVQYIELFKTPDSSQSLVDGDGFYYYSEIQEPTANSTAGYGQDAPDGHGTHTAGTAAGAIIVDALGACPAGAVSGCVGECLTIQEAIEARDGDAFNIDTNCPTFGCNGNGPAHASCLSNDPMQNVRRNSGVARGAKLAVFDVSAGDQWRSMEVGNDLWVVSARTGAKIHSNSWGMAETWCEFGEWDVQYDTFMYENPEHLLVFAAGNDGGLKDIPSNDTGCTIVSPALGKNTLTVGATSTGPTRSPLTGSDGRLRYEEMGLHGIDAEGKPYILMDPRLGLPSETDEGARIDTVAYFSAYGPTKDGRIKPEIVAPGDRVFSAASDGSDSYSCALAEMHGTSTSCPIAAGSAALVRQYFSDPAFYAHDVEARGFCRSNSTFTCDAFSPSAATVKALLINSANLMGGSPQPDTFRGFGRIQLEKGMPIGGHGEIALFVADSLTTNITQYATDVYTFNVNASAGLDFRATLSWIDPPSTTYSTRHLLHDLDLVVVDPSGAMRQMWDGTPDTSNVNERVIVPADEVVGGSWTVEVSAAALTTFRQSYSIVVRGALIT